MTHQPTPAVFILESNTLQDEREDFNEGGLLQKILHLSGMRSEYFYFRTRRELKELCLEFQKSTFRYLHLACHGNEDIMATTFDNLNFADLAALMGPYLNNRRLFLSACSMTNPNLAKVLFQSSKCISMMGPADDIAFGDAAVFWAAFYRVMFKENSTPMSRDRIVAHARTLAAAFGVNLNYFGRRDNSTLGYTISKIRENMI